MRGVTLAPSRLWSLAALALLGGVACDPIGPIPGGRLSGTVAESPPADWSFSDQEKNVQLETQPSDPYSVNVWGAGIGDRFYLASGKGGDAAWAEHIQADPEVRLRISDTLYELRAVRVEDEAEIEQALTAMQGKYDFEPSQDQRAAAWLFRLGPR